MRILFMGTPEFAVEQLRRLVETGHEICGVFTQPDKPKNRGMKMTFSPVKEYALSQGLDVYQPTKMRDGSALEIVEKLQPELTVVAAYGRILPEDILAVPPMGSINVHSSILPQYRGAAPINWAILDGCKETGVTIMHMAKELDAGDIICVKKTEILPDENAQELTYRLALLGADALEEAVAQLANGTAARTPQDHSAFTYAPMLSKELSPMDWTKPAQKLHDQVRGLIPWPCASTELGGKKVKIFRTKIGEKTNAGAGTILTAGKQGLEIACGDGRSLWILEMQAEGGKRMMAADYLRGHPIETGK
jgi:methionyl-tRNA formyltransferase